MSDIPIPPVARHALRASMRLRGMFCLLILAVVAVIFLAVNAAQAGRVGLLPAGSVVNKKPTVDSPADSGEAVAVALGKDSQEYLANISRSFEEPDFSLLTSQQPHEIGCDVPLEGDDSGVLLFIGIFSHAKGRSRRDLYRRLVIPDFPPELVTIKFILGKSAEDANIRSKMAYGVSTTVEMMQHNDMVMLDIPDNIDNGKTHEYFKWVAKQYGGPGHVKGRPRFVMKTDDDTLLVMPNIISAFKSLDCAKNVYWGTSAGSSHYFGYYFRGLAYALSWPLVSWIGEAPMPVAHVVKIEDARTAQWLRMLNPVTDPVQMIDLGWSMGDWNQLDYTTETMALHWLKHSDWVGEQRERIMEVWRKAGKPYTKDTGVPLADSIRHGSEMPSAAKAELQRQHEAGWDTNVVVEDEKEEVSKEEEQG